MVKYDIDPVVNVLRINNCVRGHIGVAISLLVLDVHVRECARQQSQNPKKEQPSKDSQRDVRLLLQILPPTVNCLVDLRPKLVVVKVRELDHMPPLQEHQ